MEIESLRLEFHVLCLFLRSLFSFPIFLLFLSEWYLDPECPSSPYSSTKQTKVILSHLPLVLFFSHSPFPNFQSPKKPKNKVQYKNWLNRKPKPKNKKNTLRRRGQWSKRSQRRWTTTPLVLISIGAAIMASIRCIVALSLCVYFVVEVEMGLLFIMGLWVCCSLSFST